MSLHIKNILRACRHPEALVAEGSQTIIRRFFALLRMTKQLRMTTNTRKILLLTAMGSTTLLANGEPVKTSPDVLNCQKAFHKFAMPFKDLWQKRPKDLKVEDTNGLGLMEDMSPTHCTEPTSKTEFLTLLTRLLNQHSGQIAVILPLSTKPVTKHLLKGMNQYLKDQGLDPSKVILVMDSQSNATKTLELLSNAVFKHQVSAIIGGYESNEIGTLSNFATKFMIPTFILNKPPVVKPSSPFIFYSHPTPKGIATALVNANLKFSHKKVSVLKPMDQHSDELAKEYEEQAKIAGIKVLHNVTYDPRRIDNMESSARKLFQLQPNERTEELKKLYESAKVQAKESGIAFNPKMIALQPVVEQEAILILDQFKTARHMAKIFTYLGVKKLPLVGNYEWRSSGLIEPFDPIFIGSYFVDIVGLYSSLPAGLQVSSSKDNSPFASPDKVEEIDLSIIGYRAMVAPLNLSKLKSTPRRKLNQSIPRADEARPLDVNFDKDNAISWPTALFEVTAQGKGGTISLR